VLACFPTVVGAVRCACAIINGCGQAAGLQLRIGIHLGDIVFDNDDVFGDGVNIAARLQALAPVNGIWVSESVYTNVANKKDIKARFVRAEVLKNVKEPVRVYEVITEHSQSGTSGGISREAPQPPSNRSIAVLPFVNMSSDPEQEFFSDGLTEEIIADLSQLQNLLVISRSSMMTFKGTSKKITEIAGGKRPQSRKPAAHHGPVD
jgi:adenylate cyclase